MLSMMKSIVWLLAASSHVAAVSVSFPLSVPSNAGPPFSPAFAAFAFEERSFYYVAGPAGKPNTFAVNLIQNIGSFTNSHPAIRVGGSSLNEATYVPTQSQALIVPAAQLNNPRPSGILLGPSFFSSFKNIPNAQYLLDIPMTKKTSTVAGSVAFAKQAYQTIGSANIYTLELGNEPDLYGAGYGVPDYVAEFANYSTAIQACSAANRPGRIQRSTNKLFT